MAIEKKGFLGGLDSDTEDRLLPNGDYRYSLNIRASKSDGANEGSIENTKGNSKVSYQFNLGGTFKTIGSYDDIINSKVYYFVWASSSAHLLLEYDVTNNIINKVLESPLLNLDVNNPIISQNIVVLDGKIYWVNGQPYKINIERAKTGGYPNPIREENITAIVPPPILSPDCIWGSTDGTISGSIKTNNVRGKLFQFRYKFVYEDNEESAWSPISKTSLPINEGRYRPFGYYDSTINNFITVTVGVGNEIVKRVKIAFREGNTGDFYLAKDLDKNNLTLGVADYDFNFYNNEVYTPLDNNGNQGMRLYDWIPLLSNTQSLIDGNKITYGGITENYDPVNIDVTVSPIYGAVPETQPVAVGSGLSYQIVEVQQLSIDPSIYQNIQGNNLTPSNVGNVLGGSVYWGKRAHLHINTYTSAAGRGFSDTVMIEPSFGGLNGHNGLWLTTEHSLEAVIYNDSTGVVPEGNKFIVSVSASWRDFRTHTWEYKTFVFQEISVAGDDCIAVLNRLRNQINNLSDYNTGGAIIKLSSSSATQWSRGYSTNLSNARCIYIQVEGYIDPSQIQSISNYTSLYYYMNPLPALYSASVSIKSYASWTSNIEKTLKMGARHGIGLVYYDKYNRSTLANTSDDTDFYVKFPTERGIQANYITDVVELDVEVNHSPPSWATHYQFVYTGNQTVENLQTGEGYKGFIQARLDNVKTSATINGALESRLSNISDYSNGVPELISIAYSFTKGDRIRFIKDANNDYYNKYIDVEIISYDDTSKLLTFKNPDVYISGAVVAEIYTPKKNSEEDYYYEIGEVYQINNGYHTGNTQDQSPTSPAKLRLTDIGDVYLRYRELPMKTQVEDYNYSDFYDSDSWDKGRVYIVDKNIKQIYRPTTIRYSEAFIPETNINGLSQFNDFSFEAYDHKYGDIKLMYSEDKSLLVFQQLKVGSVGVNQNTLYSNDGATVGTVRNETKVLSDIRYYAGEFGIGNNPESFSVYGNMKYWADAKRGSILRLGGDGITQISEYKMHNYWTDKLQEIDGSIGGYKIYGVYDVRFDEYILHLVGGNISETIAYSETKNRWVTFYSYAPDFMVSNRTGLITFKNGELFNHNTNSVYNNFYGVQHSTELEFVSNIEPGAIKMYNSLYVESSNVFEMPEATNQYGQKTSLITDDFEDVEGVWKAAFLKDENTPNVNLPLIEGDTIRCNSLTIKLRNNDTDFVKIFSVGVNVELSELTNR